MSILTKSRHNETNAELGLHSLRFVLSKQAHHSCDKIAFLPDGNSSEYLTFFAFRDVYLGC